MPVKDDKVCRITPLTSYEKGFNQAILNAAKAIMEVRAQYAANHKDAKWSRDALVNSMERLALAVGDASYCGMGA